MRWRSGVRRCRPASGEHSEQERETRNNAQEPYPEDNRSSQRFFHFLVERLLCWCTPSLNQRLGELL